MTLQVGGLQTNCYILTAPGTRECVVIDPGAEPQRVIDELRSVKLEVRYILSTHGHADHTGGVSALVSETGGLYYLDPADTFFSEEPPAWIVVSLGGFTSPPETDPGLIGASSVQLGESLIQFIRTPGHSPGSTCFKFEGMVFTGDTLFRGSIGRYDLPGGDGRQEIESIRARLLTLPDETVVYPGHGPSSSIGEERRNNPYLQS
jgi:glyoxylase-like metal-dependent hydrolase (beta-lactamase superfamily II)